MNTPLTINQAAQPSARMLRILLNLGHLSLFFMLALWGTLYALKGEPYEHTGEIILLTIFFGRAAAVGTGLNLGFGALFLFYQAVIADLFIMLYVYPLFVRNFDRLTHIPLLGGYLDNLHNVALRYKTRIAPYGIAGLMLFVLFPFWSTGVLVGSIVGYLIGLPAVTTILSVTIGNILAIAAWVWFYDLLNDWNKSASLGLLVAIFAVTGGGFLFSRLKRHKKRPPTD